MLFVIKGVYLDVLLTPRFAMAPLLLTLALRLTARCIGSFNIKEGLVVEKECQQEDKEDDGEQKERIRCKLQARRAQDPQEGCANDQCHKVRDGIPVGSTIQIKQNKSAHHNRINLRRRAE